MIENKCVYGIMVGNIQILEKVPEMSGPNRADNTDTKANQYQYPKGQRLKEESNYG
jgi:hypothetical protein